MLKTLDDAARLVVPFLRHGDLICSVNLVALPLRCRALEAAAVLTEALGPVDLTIKEKLGQF